MVEVAILAKNLTADRVTVNMEEQRLGITILDESGNQVDDFCTKTALPVASKTLLLAQQQASVLRILFR